MGLGEKSSGLDEQGIEDLLAEFGQGIEQEGEYSDQAPSRRVINGTVAMPMAMGHQAGSLEEIVPQSASFPVQADAQLSYYRLSETQEIRWSQIQSATVWVDGLRQINGVLRHSDAGARSDFMWALYEQCGCEICQEALDGS